MQLLLASGHQRTHVKEYHDLCGTEGFGHDYAQAKDLRTYARHEKAYDPCGCSINGIQAANEFLVPCALRQSVIQVCMHASGTVVTVRKTKSCHENAELRPEP